MTRTDSRPIRLLLTMLGLLLGGLMAQSPAGGGVVRGRVLDPSGAAVARAQITVIAGGGVTQQASTNAQGMFTLHGLPAGTAQLIVSAAGFAPYQGSVAVGGGTAAPVDIHLKLGTAQQQVSVSAQATTVNLQPADRAAAVELSGKALQSLADDPDQLATDLAALAGPSVGGAGADIYIDGFTRGDIPPKSAIASVEVNNDPFSPEFNRLGYGRVQITTKPGSQKLHGNLEYDGNNASFNALQPFLKAAGSAPPAYHSNIYSADVSGPLGQRFSWFLAVERRDIQSVSVVNAQILSPALTPEAFVTSVPNPNGRTAMTPRFDWQVTPNNILTARYQLQRRVSTGGGVGGFSLPSQAYDQDSTRHNLQLGDTQLLGAAGVNRLRYQYVHIHDNNAAAESGPTLDVLGAFTGGGNNTGSFQRTEIHHDLREDLTLNYGSHQLGLGGEVADVNRTETSTANYNGTFVFPSLTVYQATEQGLAAGETMAQIQAAGFGPSQFTLAAGNPTAHIDRLDASLYLQDAWQMRRNLMVNYGLRFETENIPHDTADWAPRLGVAWGLGGGSAPATVLRAGFGIFYQRNDDDQMIVVAHLNGHNQQQYTVTAPAFYPTVPAAASLSQASAALPTAYLFSPQLQAPPTMTASVSLERQFGRAASLSVSFLHSYGWDQLLTEDINAPLPGTYDPANPASGVRPYGNAAGNLYEYDPAGVSRQNQVTVNFKIHPAAAVSLNGYYSFNDAHADAFGPDSFATNPWNILADYGPAPWDVRHRFYAGGTFSLPWGVQANPFIVAQSGQPFSLTLGEDLFGTGQQDGRPALVTAATPAADVMQTPYGAFDIHPGPGAEMIAPDTETGPAAFAVNLRLMKHFGLGGGKEGRQLGVGIEARNLLNNVNFATPVGNVLSPLFGQSVGLQGGEYSSGAANRRIDLLLTFSF